VKRAAILAADNRISSESFLTKRLLTAKILLPFPIPDIERQDLASLAQPYEGKPR